ncbi:MAG: zinc ABC transporter substrate-binding protein [Gammaproteobacteria bacterium]
MKYVFLICLFCQTLWAKVPDIVVTIKPIHALVSGVMAGVTEPTLLLPPGTSPHSFNLKPSQRKAISEADLIVWVGPDLENVMIQTLKSVPPEKKLKLIDGETIRALPYRSPHHHHEHDHDHNHHHALDPHVWINTDFAKLIVQKIEANVVELDPEHAATYQANANRLYERLASLKIEIQNRLAPHQQVPFLVYHDAYQYFESEFGLQAATVINANPHAPMSAKKIIELQKIISKRSIHCVCTEPEYGDKILNAFEFKDMKHVVLDALGVYQKAPNEDAYFEMMRDLSEQLAECLR